MKKIAIVILNFNGEDDTKECLWSIDNLSKKNFKILSIVIDNGSKEVFKIDGSDFKTGELKIIRSENNLGFTGGNNLGIKYALEKKADYILIINNDTIIDPRLIEELLAISEKNETSGIIGPKIYFAKGREFHKERYKNSELGKVIWYAGGVMDWKNIVGYHRGVDEVDNAQYEQEVETDFASGCCMFIKKEVFEKIGFFNEKYFLYYEDSDFNQRAKKANYKIIYAPKAILWHKNARSAGGSGSTLQDYYITRNRLLFGFRYGSFRAKAALVKESFKTLLNGRKWQKRGVLDFYRRRFGKGSFVI